MTSRELLALTVIALPALAAVLVLLAPTGLVTGLVRFASVPVAALAFALTLLALRASGKPVIGDWLVVAETADLVIGIGTRHIEHAGTPVEAKLCAARRAAFNSALVGARPMFTGVAKLMSPSENGNGSSNWRAFCVPAFAITRLGSAEVKYMTLV